MALSSSKLNLEKVMNHSDNPTVVPRPTPRRRLRNYLLDRRFQLKYTSVFVFTAISVAAVLGAIAYDYSHGQTEALSAQLAAHPDFQADMVNKLESWSSAQDRKVLMAILSGIAILALVLGITGIIITHRMVGPAYRLKKMFYETEKGRYRMPGRLRRGDELQDVFDAFVRVIDALRARNRDMISRLELALLQHKSSSDEGNLEKNLSDMRDRLKAEIET